MRISTALFPLTTLFALHVEGLAITPFFSLHNQTLPHPHITYAPNISLLRPPNTLSTPHDPSFWYQDGDTIVTEYYAFQTYRSHLNVELQSCAQAAYLQAVLHVDVGQGDQLLGEEPRIWSSEERIAYLLVEPGKEMTWLMLYEMTIDVVPFWQAKHWAGGMSFQIWRREAVEVLGKGELYLE